LKLCSFFLPGVSAVWRWSKTRKALSSEIRNLLHMRDKFNDRLPRVSWKVAYAVDQRRALCVRSLWKPTECLYTKLIRLFDQQICQSYDWKLLKENFTVEMLALLSVRDGWHSNFSSETSYPDLGFQCLFQSFQIYVTIAPQIDHDRFLSHSLTIIIKPRRCMI
jgi:hypothetical protein